jgi:hypothetical protein
MFFQWLFCGMGFILHVAAGNQDKPAGLERRFIPQKDGDRESPKENNITVIYK